MIGNRLIVALKHQGIVAHCTACGATSSRIHGWYRRRVEDLPCSGHRVTLEIHVQHFRCDNIMCRRRTFAPCLAQFGARQQRRTARAQTVLWHVGLALSDAAGARLAQRLGISISGETMLRLLKRNGQKYVATTFLIWSPSICKAIVRGRRVVADLYPDSIAGVPAGPDGLRRKGPNLISGLEVREMSQACLRAVQPVLPSFNTPVQPWMG
ncbi:transposase family protein (plasmid) [Mycetohabitans rhizoxinica]|uniref:transposase family protein n=1 Tax=Mycetohabitans rhizoxinica TaxID=412963 RepID=UPI0030CB50F9